MEYAQIVTAPFCGVQWVLVGIVEAMLVVSRSIMARLSRLDKL